MMCVEISSFNVCFVEIFVDGVWIEIMDIMYDFVGILLNDVC